MLKFWLQRNNDPLLIVLLTILKRKARNSGTQTCCPFCPFCLHKGKFLLSLGCDIFLEISLQKQDCENWACVNWKNWQIGLNTNNNVLQAVRGRNEAASILLHFPNVFLYLANIIEDTVGLEHLVHTHVNKWQLQGLTSNNVKTTSTIQFPLSPFVPHFSLLLGWFLLLFLSPVIHHVRMWKSKALKSRQWAPKRGHTWGMR